MRARLLRIGLLVIALGVAGCGGDDDGGTSGGGDSSTSTSTTSGGTSGGGGGGVSGSSIADATAVAEALDCADSFQATDAAPMMGPVPDSAGSCDAEGGVTIEVYGSAADVEEIVTDFPTVGCPLLQGFGIERFITVAGENWMVSVGSDTDGTASERVATALDGQVYEFDCA